MRKTFPKIIPTREQRDAIDARLQVLLDATTDQEAQNDACRALIQGLPDDDLPLWFEVIAKTPRTEQTPALAEFDMCPYYAIIGVLDDRGFGFQEGDGPFIESTTQRHLTVADLIERLDSLPKNAEVFLTAEGGMIAVEGAPLLEIHFGDVADAGFKVTLFGKH